MTPVLTTITPYWQRSDALTVWLKAITVAPTEGVVHLLICRDYPPPWLKDYRAENLIIYHANGPGMNSIGHYHNLGAKLAQTDWIMKLDVDCIPHTQYFRELLEVVNPAQPRQWFNGGMYYIDRPGSNSHLMVNRVPVTVQDYYKMVQSCSKHHFSAGTNFICRRSDYLTLGGCDERFSGYGWEDYQQIYMLEAHQRGKCPLGGEVNEGNVTQRCRDEISRRKAHELIELNERLGLLHRWHPTPVTNDYKNNAQMGHNKKVLLDYITQKRIENGTGK